MPKSWSDKDERQYERIKDSEKERGRSTERAKEIAAAEGRSLEGESAATPLIVVLGIAVVVTVLFAVFGALAIGAYYLF